MVMVKVKAKAKVMVKYGSGNSDLPQRRSARAAAKRRRDAARQARAMRATRRQFACALRRTTNRRHAPRIQRAQRVAFISTNRFGRGMGQNGPNGSERVCAGHDAWKIC